MTYDEMKADFVDTPWHLRYPEMDTGPVSNVRYYSDEEFQREENVFRSSWLNVGRVEDLRAPGDYEVYDLAFLGQSVVVTRDHAGNLNAFHNSCSHRGNKVAIRKRGTAKRFVCAYHGWQFSLDGSCDHIPDEQSFIGMADRACLGLEPVNVAAWNGFVFINLDPRPEETLEDYLGPIAEEFADYPFQEFSATAIHYSSIVPANWKLCRDAFSETYHVQFVHKRSAPKVNTRAANPYSHMFDLKLYDRHSRRSPYLNPDYVRSPMEQFFKDLRSAGVRSDKDSWIGRRMTQTPGWYQDSVMLFPNFNMALSAGQMFGTYFSYNFWPVSVSHTRLDHSVYFREPENAAVRAAQEYGKVLQRDIWLEDYDVLPYQQEGVASRAKAEFQLQNQELTIRHANHVMDRAIQADKEAEDGQQFTDFRGAP